MWKNLALQRGLRTNIIFNQDLETNLIFHRIWNEKSLYSNVSDIFTKGFEQPVMTLIFSVNVYIANEKYKRGFQLVFDCMHIYFYLIAATCPRNSSLYRSEE